MSVLPWIKALVAGRDGLQEEDARRRRTHADRTAEHARLRAAPPSPDAQRRNAERIVADVRARVIPLLDVAGAVGGGIEPNTAGDGWVVRKPGVPDALALATAFEVACVLDPDRVVAGLVAMAGPGDATLPDLAARLPRIAQLERDIRDVEVEHGRFVDGTAKEFGITLPLMEGERARRARAVYDADQKRKLGPPAMLERPTTFMRPPR